MAAVLLQVVFVCVSQTGIRYDALKVYDESIAIFSQGGIYAEDLEGYFARYTNNHAMVMMTYLILKVLRAVHIVASDFSNAVAVLQLVNIAFVDLAFAGAFVFLKQKHSLQSACCFVLFMAVNPLSYVWLPFYYTNTCSMFFAIWGINLFWMELASKKKKAVWQILFSGILFYLGFKIRATVAICVIAVFITLLLIWREKKKLWQLLLLGVFFLAGIVFAANVYGIVENRYVAFDTADTAFPPTHWIAMGLEEPGGFNALDEAYTMSYPTKEEKKEAVANLIKERLDRLGPVGLLKLYGAKLSDTFGDGTGGYHSELNLSRKYGFTWQNVYGVHRDPLMCYTQLVYLISLFGGIYMAVSLWKKEKSFLLVVPLTLLGSYLFQMIWEAGTVYSIGLMYLNGMCAAFAFCGQQTKAEQAKQNVVEQNETKQPEEKQRKEKSDESVEQTGRSGFSCDRKKIPLIIAAMGCLAFVISMVITYQRTHYVEVSMSVDQFLFQANQYISVSDGMEVSQTFSTSKEFHTIALRVSNATGSENDSRYEIALYDGDGKLLQTRELLGEETSDYAFYAMDFDSVQGVSDYEIRIRKTDGK